ncbi:hypothetical protein DH2020_014747 [Rehmannia glutinosa]|uniref:26S proteasome regulatory subunit RPN13 n=1 Tax=Rehmannia glutinosa TaxID=99300 RepID=A0ABR0X0G3_REHGL
MVSSVTDDFPPIQWETFEEVLLEFRAGKMLIDGTRVIPDSRKGLVRIGKGEEGLIHFQWLDRSLNIVEDDQIVFPDEAVFEKVNQSSGRVYILKFHTDDRKFFFWLQEPKAENDTQLCNSINFHLNLPLELPGEDEPDASASVQSSENMVEDDISSRAGNLVGPSMGAEATSDVTSAGPVKLVDLQRILSNIGPAVEQGDPDAGMTFPHYCIIPMCDCEIDSHIVRDLIAQNWPLLCWTSIVFSRLKSMGHAVVKKSSLALSSIEMLPLHHLTGGLGLGDILKPEFIWPLVQELPLHQQLASYLPEGEWTPEELIELLQSPPFRQQLDSFTYVLRTGQVDLTQFGIDPSKYKFTVPSFLEALEDSVARTSESEESAQKSQTCPGSDTMDEGQ